MPELPEVQTVVDSLQSLVTSCVVRDIYVDPTGEKAILPPSPALLREKLIGKQITAVTRRGKFIIMELDHGPAALVTHLRMTGVYSYRSSHNSNSDNQLALGSYPESVRLNNNPGDSSAKAGRINYHRFSILLDKGELIFTDKRRFATLHYTDDIAAYKGINKLGPEAISDNFSADYLYTKGRTKGKGIYSSLLDQEFVAGIGNIYACESLAASFTHPLTPTNELTKEQAESLVTEVKRILFAAIAAQGTSFSDFVSTGGQQGNYKHALMVYRKLETRVGDRDYAVARLKIGGRTAHFIPALQIYQSAR